MKTTIEIPDELFRKAKATAALEGDSLRQLICEALETRLASPLRSEADRSGWRTVFGLAEPKTVEKLARLIAADLERIDSSEWR